MTKKIVLTAFVALFAASVTYAQSDAQPRSGAENPAPQKVEQAPKPKTAKDSDKIRHAEEKSNGAAFSGRGKGGEKSQADKQYKGKGKTKTKNKSKEKTKGQGTQSPKPVGDQEVKDVPQHGDNNPDEAANKKEVVNKKKEPKQSTGERRPGQRPATGKEKENDH